MQALHPRLAAFAGRLLIVPHLQRRLRSARSRRTHWRCPQRADRQPASHGPPVHPTPFATPSEEPGRTSPPSHLPLPRSTVHLRLKVRLLAEQRKPSELCFRLLPLQVQRWDPRMCGLVPVNTRREVNIFVTQQMFHVPQRLRTDSPIPAPAPLSCVQRRLQSCILRPRLPQYRQSEPTPLQ